MDCRVVAALAVVFAIVIQVPVIQAEEAVPAAPAPDPDAALSPWLPELGIKTSMGLTHVATNPLEPMFESKPASMMEFRQEARLSVVLRRYRGRYLWLALATELTYSVRSGRIRGPTGRESWLALRYLEVPVLGRIDIPGNSHWSPFAVAGIAAGRLRSAHLSPALGEDVRAMVYNHDLSWVAGVGARYAVSTDWNASVQVRYQQRRTSAIGPTHGLGGTVLLCLGCGWPRSRS